MADFLATIERRVRERLEIRRRAAPEAALRDREFFHAPRRGFARVLSGPGRRIIAEVKKASPSRGVIREPFDPVAIARDYDRHGASAISVLTEEEFFQGSLEYLEAIRRAVGAPLLRKDFIIDSYQLIEAKAYGADAVLFIAALLDSGRLRDLNEQAAALALDGLVEVHSEEELATAVEARARLIGINNRDLKTFKVDLSTTEKLAPRVPAGELAICESGIDTLEQIRRVEHWGVRVFLIGEALMRAPEPGKKLAQLLETMSCKQ